MILLDTPIFVRVAAGAPLKAPQRYEEDDLVVSAISAAEVACLVKRDAIRLDTSPDVWFEAAARRMGAVVLPLGAGLLARAFLLDWAHRDPADRILVQTLRENPDQTLHTRDAEVLRYCAAHGLPALDCR